jgi:hypothetical protein
VLAGGGGMEACVAAASAWGAGAVAVGGATPGAPGVAVPVSVGAGVAWVGAGVKVWRASIVSSANAADWSAAGSGGAGGGRVRGNGGDSSPPRPCSPLAGALPFSSSSPLSRSPPRGVLLGS